jgi:hypothetical protein
LAVEQEARVRGVGLEQVEELVDEVDELHAVHLERRVPLSIPMGVGNDADRSRVSHDGSGYGSDSAGYSEPFGFVSDGSIDSIQSASCQVYVAVRSRSST